MNPTEAAIEPIRAISEGTFICGGTPLASEVAKRMSTVFGRPGVTPEMVEMFIHFINAYRYPANRLDERGYISREGQQCEEYADGLESSLESCLMSAIAYGHCIDPQACAALLREMHQEDTED